MDDLGLIKVFKLRSDKNSLEKVYYDLKALIRNNFKKRSKSRIRLLVLVVMLLLSTYLLSFLSEDWLFVTTICATVFFVIFLIELVQRIKIFIGYKQLSKWFISITNRYEHTDIVHYHLFEDKIVYTGEKEIVYHWADFDDFLDYEYYFALHTGDIQDSFWIPKSVIEPHSDFEEFKEISRKKISDKNNKMIVK